jgi:hypothetical protein
MILVCLRKCGLYRDEERDISETQNMKTDERSGSRTRMHSAGVNVGAKEMMITVPMVGKLRIIASYGEGSPEILEH